MNFSKIPVALLIIITVFGILLVIEIGYRLGKWTYQKKKTESDSVVSSVSGYVLGLIAFIMAFTFGIVSNRYDAKKTLVIDESNAIRTAWFRSDFLPDSDRAASKKLLMEFVESRVAGIESKDESAIQQSLLKCEGIQKQLWDIAVTNGYRDLNSDIGSLYVEALNTMDNVHVTRVIVSLYARIPIGIYIILMILVMLGMILVGYMSAISGSSRSWAFFILAATFALVVGMVYTMDKLYSPFTPIPQFAMEQLLDFMKHNL